MKKLITYIIITLCSCIVIMIGCGNTKTIDGIKYDTYGLFNEKDKKDPNIEYQIIVGNVIWSIVLSETIIAPIYFVGFSMYEPIQKINRTEPKGIDY